MYAWRSHSIEDILFARQCHHRLHSNLPEHTALSVHEQPLQARMPRRSADVTSYEDTQWPWAVFRENGLPGVNAAFAARVNGCAVGLVKENRDMPVYKPWKIEVRNGPCLKAVLASFRCAGDHEQAHIISCCLRAVRVKPFHLLRRGG